MIEKTEMHINNLCTYNEKVLNHFICLMIHVGINVHVARIFQRKYITRSIRGYMIKKNAIIEIFVARMKNLRKHSIV